MLVNLNGKPYFDTLTEDRLKLYRKILFNGGVNLQSRELNEILTTVAYQIQMLGKTLYNDGSIVAGGGIILGNKTVKLLPIEVYIAGHVHPIDATDLVISGIGTEILGVKLMQSIVTSVEDVELLDPAPGKNYGRSGADRLSITAHWGVNDPDAFPIYTLIDGGLKNEVFAPESDSFSEWLARRTNDESGSYTVTGLTGYIVPKDADNVTLVIEAGKCYVQGWEISRPSPAKIDILKSKETQLVTNETKTYVSGTTDYMINSQPVKSLNQLTAQVQKTVTMTRGSTPGGADLLPDTPVTSVVNVVGYASGTNYLLSGNSIDWSPGGTEPASGATYSVTFIYTKTMVVGIDYELYHSVINGKDYVRFLAGDKPNNDSTFQFDYNFYLNRKDLFYLTKDGDIRTVTGPSAIVPPLPQIPMGVLLLGDLDLPANSDDVIVRNYDPKRLTMQELRDLRSRLDRIEYNSAIEDLDNMAEKMDQATSKKGLFTDGFLNMNKMDSAYPGFSCSIDPAKGALMTAFIQTTKDIVAVNTGTASINSRTVTKPYTEVVSISQMNATELMNINQYRVFNRDSIISVTPNQDNWIVSERVTETVYRWWDEWITGTTAIPREGAIIQETTTNTERSSNSISTSVILDEAILTIRPREITITGSKFMTHSDNLKCSFDGIQVPLTIADVGSAGTTAGTVKTNANGEFVATFTIPPNVPVGTREIIVWNEV